MHELGKTHCRQKLKAALQRSQEVNELHMH